jgi:hypothetical protein
MGTLGHLLLAGATAVALISAPIMVQPGLDEDHPAGCAR